MRIGKHRSSDRTYRCLIAARRLAHSVADDLDGPWVLQYGLGNARALSSVLRDTPAHRDVAFDRTRDRELAGDLVRALRRAHRAARRAPCIDDYPSDAIARDMRVIREAAAAGNSPPDEVLARLSAPHPIRIRIPDAVFDQARELARTLISDVERACADVDEDGLFRDAVARARRAGTASSARQLLVITIRLLPGDDRARYAEEFGAELAEIAQVRGNLGSQLAYAARQALSVWRLRGELQAPRRHGVVQ